MEFKDLFFKWRKENHLTQKEAAELIGVSISSYNRFEKFGLFGRNVGFMINQYYKANNKEFGGEVNVE
jgi:Helix-turn-helix.